MADLIGVSTLNGAAVDGLTVRQTRLMAFKAFNAGAAGFVQVFDTLASVSTGTVPRFVWQAPASQAIEPTWPAGYAQTFASGIRFELSSVASVYASHPAQMFINVMAV